MRAQVLIAEPLDFSPAAMSVLQAAADVHAAATTRAQMPAALSHYDVVWFRLAHRIDRQMLGGALRTRILATPVTGLDHIDLAACAERGIRVVSLKGETEFLRDVRATAELTVALTLALLRQLPAAAAHVLAGGWQRDCFRGRELFGKTVGLVGIGRLGQLVAGYFAAFGCEVLAFDPRANFPAGPARRVERLADLLAASDIVSLHVSYGESTRHLIGASELAALRPGAVLVNTARGGVIDEAALLAALQAGHLAGAALDVLEGEPDIAAAHPLVAYARDHAHVLIVPHIGGNTVESFAKTECFLARRVVEAIADAGFPAA